MKQQQYFFPYDLKHKSRVELTYSWLPMGIENMLDVGCSYGYGTKFYALKSKRCYGIDCNNEYVQMARKMFSEIKFSQAQAENLPYQDGFFDVVTMNDVIEHVDDIQLSLNEVYRVLRDDGILILTAPHKGLFRWIDVVNFSFMRNQLRRKSKRYSNLRWHHHYSEEEIINMLDRSHFGGFYEVLKRRKFGLLFGEFRRLVEVVMAQIISYKYIYVIIKPLRFLERADNSLSYGHLSYNVALKIQKKANHK